MIVVYQRPARSCRFSGLLDDGYPGVFLVEIAFHILDDEANQIIAGVGIVRPPLDTLGVITGEGDRIAIVVVPGDLATGSFFEPPVGNDELVTGLGGDLAVAESADAVCSAMRAPSPR